MAADRRQISYSVRAGHGRVWNEVLPRLSSLVSLRTPLTKVGPFGSRLVVPPGLRPDVWLISGHHGAWPSTAPVVSVVYEAGWDTPQLRGMLTPEFAKMADDNTRWAVRDSDWVIVPAESSRSQVVASYLVHPERVRVVPLGVDLERFNPARSGAAEIVARAGGGQSRPYVLFAASVHPRKNLAAVREAMVGIARRGLPHRLVVVAGPAADRDDPALDQMAGAELPGAPDRIVRVRDPDDDTLAALMAGAEAFCLPSFFEGFGLTVLEAMACGTAVVTSNRGALPEVVGDTGLAVEPTAEAVEDALARILTDQALRSQMGCAARARAETMSWDRTAAGWHEVLARAAAEAA